MQKNSFFKYYFRIYTLAIILIPLLYYICCLNITEYNSIFKSIEPIILYLFPFDITCIAIIGALILLLCQKKNKESKPLDDIEASATGSYSNNLLFYKSFFWTSLIVNAINTCIILFVINKMYINSNAFSLVFGYYILTSYIIIILLTLAFNIMASSWPKLKWASVFFFFFLLLILGSLFSVCMVSINRGTFEDDFFFNFYNIEDQGEEVAVDQAYAYTDNTITEAVTTTETESTEAETQEETYKNYLDFLWKNPKNDRDSIIHALQTLNTDRYDKTNLIDYYNFEDLKNTDNNSALSIIVRYIDYNKMGIDLYSIFRTYRPYIKMIVSDDSYKKNRYDVMISMLINSYSDLVEYYNDDTPEYSNFEAIYDLMERIDNENYQSRNDIYIKYYNAIKHHMGSYYIEKYNYFNDDVPRDYQTIVWAYSFWGRRCKEKNIEQVYKIITDIYNMYPSVNYN